MRKLKNSSSLVFTLHPMGSQRSKTAKESKKLQKGQKSAAVAATRALASTRDGCLAGQVT